MKSMKLTMKVDLTSGKMGENVLFSLKRYSVFKHCETLTGTIFKQIQASLRSMDSCSPSWCNIRHVYTGGFEGGLQKVSCVLKMCWDWKNTPALFRKVTRLVSTVIIRPARLRSIKRAARPSQLLVHAPEFFSLWHAASWGSRVRPLMEPRQNISYGW